MLFGSNKYKGANFTDNYPNQRCPQATVWAGSICILYGPRGEPCNGYYQHYYPRPMERVQHHNSKAHRSYVLAPLRKQNCRTYRSDEQRRCGPQQVSSILLAQRHNRLSQSTKADIQSPIRWTPGTLSPFMGIDNLSLHLHLC